MDNMVPNQEQYFNNMGIYEFQDSLALILSTHHQHIIKKSCNQLVKRFGIDQVCDKDGHAKHEIVVYFLDFINKLDSYYDFDYHDYDRIKDLVEQYI